MTQDLVEKVVKAIWKSNDHAYIEGEDCNENEARAAIAIVRAAENEACAKIAERGISPYVSGTERTIAAAIRARLDQKDTSHEK